MDTKASTIKQLLRALPANRRATIAALRTVILENIDTPFAEGVENGAIAYFLPHSVYPAGYHCDPTQPLPFAGIAAQKHHIGLYLFCVYSDPGHEAWFRAAWLKAGKKFDMGKSCVRVKTLEDVPLEVVGKLFKRVKAKAFVANYESSIPPSARRAREKAAAQRAAAGTKVAAKTRRAKRPMPKKTAEKVAKKRGGKRRSASI